MMFCATLSYTVIAPLSIPSLTHVSQILSTVSQRDIYDRTPTTLLYLRREDERRVAAVTPYDTL